MAATTNNKPEVT